ncbi:MAG: choice-of-anchor Q domain-containing protein [Myxococcales bacterium]|nr:choice-of-anchor Q domain-containing protein [Myxococcales bacterium]
MADNGSGGVTPETIGGVTLGGGSTGRFVNNTVVRNTGDVFGGIRCAGMQAVVNTLAHGNRPLSMMSEYWGCMLDHSVEVDCMLDGMYRLPRMSACHDAGRSMGAPGEDIEGQGRPCGRGVDVGADEYCP